jgi:hypothetical protein
MLKYPSHSSSVVPCYDGGTDSPSPVVAVVAVITVLGLAWGAASVVEFLGWFV